MWPTFPADLVTFTEKILNGKLLFLCSEAVAQRCSVKKVFLEISQNSQENTCARVSFLIKFQAKTTACNFIEKETLAQVFYCKFCEISQKTFSFRTPPVAASENGLNVTVFKYASHVWPHNMWEVFEHVSQVRISSRNNFTRVTVPFRKTNMVRKSLSFIVSLVLATKEFILPVFGKLGNQKFLDRCKNII